ncbi:hypothetical protein FQA39_LY06084 [Lamprigera yunnana]|nr:hypothetical protein FQA39_LY06084 [Lamprigera yunnana]
MRFILVLSYLSIVTCYLTINEEKFNVKKCMKDVLKSVGTETTVVYVYEKVFEDILPEKLEHPFVTIDISKKIHQNSKYQMYKEIVVLNLNHAKLVQKYLTVLEENGLWNLKSSFRRRFIIVCPSKIVSELKHVFTYFLKHNIIDVIVMTHYLNGDTKMFTWDPYDPSNKCGTEFNMKTHNSCSLLKLNANKKLGQFNKCNLTFVHSSNRETDTKRTRKAYIAGFILDEVGKNMNVTVIPKKSFPYRGKLFVQIKVLKDCENTTSCTVPFEKSRHFWTVPQRKMIHPLEVFKIVFKTDVWILILLSFVLTSVIWWLISWCTEKVNLTSALIKIYSLTIFSAMDRVPSILSLRFIFITYVMYAIHIQSIFTSNLVKLLTNVHYEPGIETLEQLAQSDLPILIVSFDIKQFRNKKRNDSLYMKIANKTHAISWNDYIKSLFNQTCLEYNSVLVGENLLQEIIIKRTVKMRVICDDTLLEVSQMTFGTKIGSHLIKPMHKIVSILFEAGLIDFKASEFNRAIEKFEYKYKGESNSNGNSSNPKVLSLTNVYPIFVFWGMGLTCATAVFIMEHIRHAMDKRLKKHPQVNRNYPVNKAKRSNTDLKGLINNYSYQR